MVIPILHSIYFRKAVPLNCLHWFHITYLTSVLHLEAPEVIILVNSVSLNTSTINITENDKLTLSCYSGDGILKARLYWSNNTEVIDLNNNDTEWSNISFLASRKNDKNNFTCTVEHEKFTYALTKSVILNVFCKYNNKHKTGNQILFLICWKIIHKIK